MPYLNRISAQGVVAQCWYMRQHMPDGHGWKAEDGSLLCTCRYCGRRIRSRHRGDWQIADGLDLDALQQQSSTGHFCVIDHTEGMVLARYPIEMDADEEAIAARMEEIVAEFGIEEGDRSLQILIVPGSKQSRAAH